jgi:hypothetical protein
MDEFESLNYTRWECLYEVIRAYIRNQEVEDNSCDGVGCTIIFCGCDTRRREGDMPFWGKNQSDRCTTAINVGRYKSSGLRARQLLQAGEKRHRFIAAGTAHLRTGPQ